MKLLNSVEKQLKKLFGKNALMILAGLVVVYMICHYSSNKGLTLDGMTDGNGEAQESEQKPQQAQASVAPAGPLGSNSDFASANGVKTTTDGLAPSCSRQPVITNSQELLPRGENQFSQINPMGGGDLQNVKRG